ncbi:MAG TPA: hypothetical protein VN937_14875, partial [Blastocatellia bacterium]|nr:hypothetical protein [Blastocatellia bacterium]
RLDDFVEEKVRRRASGGRRSSGGYGPGEKPIAGEALISSAPHRNRRRVFRSCRSRGNGSLLRKLKRFRSRIAHDECVLDLFTREHLAEIAPRNLDNGLWSIGA